MGARQRQGLGRRRLRVRARVVVGVGRRVLGVPVPSQSTATPIAISMTGQKARPPNPKPNVPGITVSPRAMSPKPRSWRVSTWQRGSDGTVGSALGSTIHATMYA